MFCCLSQHHLSLSTPQVAWAAGKEDHGKLHPPILWAWRLGIPVACLSWSAPYLMDTQESRDQLMTACRADIQPASWYLKTQQFGQWTKFLAWRLDFEGLDSDRRCCFAAGLLWVWGSRGTVSVFLAVGLWDAHVRGLCFCWHHCPQKKTVASDHSQKHLTQAGQSPQGHSAGLHTVDLQ